MIKHQRLALKSGRIGLEDGLGLFSAQLRVPVLA